MLRDWSGHGYQRRSRTSVYTGNPAIRYRLDYEVGIVHLILHRYPQAHLYSVYVCLYIYIYISTLTRISNFCLHLSCDNSTLFIFFRFFASGVSVEEIAKGDIVILSGNNRGKMGSMSLTMLIFAVSPLSRFLFPESVEGFLFFSSL